jgi:hypothetical protein
MSSLLCSTRHACEGTNELVVTLIYRHTECGLPFVHIWNDRQRPCVRLISWFLLYVIGGFNILKPLPKLRHFLQSHLRMCVCGLSVDHTLICMPVLEFCVPVFCYQLVQPFPDSTRIVFTLRIFLMYSLHSVYHNVTIGNGVMNFCSFIIYFQK